MNGHKDTIRKLEDEHAGIVTELKLKNENTIVELKAKHVHEKNRYKMILNVKVIY